MRSPTRDHADLAESDEELFEDDPIEYIRRDLEPSTESDTRRQAATEFTRALMEHFERDVTDIIKGYIMSFLQVSQPWHGWSLTKQEYASDPSGKWKSKDTAIYLLTSIASRGSTQQVRVILVFTTDLIARCHLYKSLG